MQGVSCKPSLPLKPVLLMVVVMASLAVPGCSATVEHDAAAAATALPAPDTQEKCSCYPCGCAQSPPPPSPPPPPQWPVPYCPPPPSLPAPYLYIVGTPGNLYPYEASSARRSFAVPVPVVAVAGLVVTVSKLWWP
ncbi:hypothetical protein Cni_G26343 [Canna indica]|uniref:Uncharacterized protein n=1 Tax=Canna indica TaxID=4628 RepID=A0AAQ3QR82_9LILI|nr:hypothetical protein Cni_G26343 [Canna indica]